MKPHIVRLTYGMDLRKGIEDYCLDRKVFSGYIASCAGCLKHAKIRLAGAKDYLDEEEDYEIVSLSGTVAGNGVHIHIALADETGRALGGHLAYGCIVNSTAEIVIVETEEYDLTREFDPETGYRELTIHKT